MSTIVHPLLLNLSLSDDDIERLQSRDEAGLRMLLAVQDCAAGKRLPVLPPVPAGESFFTPSPKQRGNILILLAQLTHSPPMPAAA